MLGNVNEHLLKLYRCIPSEINNSKLRFGSEAALGCVNLTVEAHEI
jgi:hypothetical protein